MYHVVNKPRLYIIRLHPKDQAAADGCHCGHTLSQLGVQGPRGAMDLALARRRLCASMPPYLLRAVITEHASSQTRREISVKSG
jgi:hypothetical protein